MKRLVTLLIACFVSGLCFVIVPSAIADKPPAPPGQGECNHGNSNQPCKPDPQPEHGKDCDTHGNNGGMNEDHCLGTTSIPDTTTTPTTITKQTTTRETTSTQTETTPQTTSIPTGTSEQTSSTNGVEGTTTVTPLPTPKCDDGSNPPCPTPDPASPLKHERKAQKTGAVKGELPFTGFPLILVALAGLSMTTMGLYLRRKNER